MSQKQGGKMVIRTGLVDGGKQQVKTQSPPPSTKHMARVSIDTSGEKSDGTGRVKLRITLVPAMSKKEAKKAAWHEKKAAEREAKKQQKLLRQQRAAEQAGQKSKQQKAPQQQQQQKKKKVDLRVRPVRMLLPLAFTLRSAFRSICA